ncbi:Protein kinase domain-containing protein [Mycena sanguinolenta]|uniref:Protein kinase domain-containing protein n=1 Tax=Mycena sanguinolenta TaxID=230812 RepID=A0A8H7CS40_9AGAR|nr:Protein kinase domain-containing protein [Mycena sanguinolenta]
MNRRSPFNSLSLKLPDKNTCSLELEDYDIMEEIASGTTSGSTVYLVNCKRGRLRNRQLALRKVSVRNSNSNSNSNSQPNEGHDTIHLPLSHPSIVSLLSTFSTPSAGFQVLELCAGGPLSRYLAMEEQHQLQEQRQPQERQRQQEQQEWQRQERGRILSEAHLRGILKSLLDALVYLKNESVVHRNIRPCNILVTAEGRIKLADFKLATHLPPSKLPPDTFAYGPHFVAPEILRNAPYTCNADIWSVGCVALACLSGRLPFEASSTPETITKILTARYVLPNEISTEAQDLLVNLLESDPQQRIAPNDALSHPFFSAEFPVGPLNLHFSVANACSSDSVLSKHALFESRPAAPGRMTTKDPVYGHRKHPRHSYAPKPTIWLSREISARRIVSDPLPRQRWRDLTPEVATAAAAASTSVASRPQLQASQQAVHSRNPQDCKPGNGAESGAPVTSPASVLPVGTTRPQPFTTDLLTPDLHKTVHGQITVLPSHALLVDLREGERRRRQKGAEVLVVSSQGTERGGFNLGLFFQIEVYSAPHLSLPCCLAEPTHKYTIEDLPATYWRQYNDAALLVERIKQRTPKLILNTSKAKCVLMANAPQGDIELLVFGSPSDISNGHKQGSGDRARMRIRLSRQTGLLEFAKHVSGARGEEWTKKVLKANEGYPHRICTEDWDALDETERESLAQLTRFLRTCEALERLEVEEEERKEEHEDDSAATSKPSKSGASRFQTGKTQSPSTDTVLPASFSSTRTLPLMNVALPPRPPKFFASASRKPAQQRAPSPSPPSIIDVTDASIQAEYPSVTGKTGILPTWCRDDTDNNSLELTAAKQRSQTKFIPTVGWCIRQVSRVSQGGRYKIMFFDGAALEIDVDEDWAELTSPGGGTTRHNIRKCNAKRHVAERMKVFSEFVSMFDDSEKE